MIILKCTGCGFQFPEGVFPHPDKLRCPRCSGQGEFYRYGSLSLGDTHRYAAELSAERMRKLEAVAREIIEETSSDMELGQDARVRRELMEKMKEILEKEYPEMEGEA